MKRERAERPLTETDLTVRSMVEAALRPYGEGVARVSQAWGSEADRWFVEVEPTHPGAASLSISFDGDDLLSVMIENTWVELFPLSDELLEELRQIVGAVLAGQVEEIGPESESAAWIGEGRARILVGTMSPSPKPVRRYAAYGATT